MRWFWWVVVANRAEVLCRRWAKDEVYVPAVDYFGDQFGEAVQGTGTRRMSFACFAQSQLYLGLAGPLGNRLAQSRDHAL